MNCDFIVLDSSTKQSIYSTEFSTKALIFSVCVSYGKRSIKMATKLADIGFEMYIKDHNDTHITKLADYLAKEVKNVKKFQTLGCREQLKLFYEWSRD